MYILINKYSPEKPKALHLEIVLDPLKVKTLGNHNDSSLNIEAQSHLGATLVVLSPDRHQELILQQGRTFCIYPEQETQINTDIQKGGEEGL